MTQNHQDVHLQPHPHTFHRDVAFCIITGIAFMQACSYSDGWLLPVITYIIAAATLFSTIKRHRHGSNDQRWFYAINALGCTGLVGALWLGGHMATLF